MPKRTHVTRSGGGGLDWEIAWREPVEALRPYVRQVQGYVERSPGRLRRKELPTPNVVVIIELAPAIRVYESGQDQRWSAYPGGFVAGLDERYTLTEHEGYQRGIQLNLTPIGARHFFGLPLAELTRRVVGLSDVLPHGERSLAERLDVLPTWGARFDLLERLLLERVHASRAATGVVAYALDRLATETVSVGELSRETGYSQKHLIALFREHVGVPPKLWAKLARFDRLVGALRAGSKQGFAELAAELAYYDQAHLTRDVKRFAGCTPSQMRLELGSAVFPAPDAR